MNLAAFKGVQIGGDLSYVVIYLLFAIRPTCRIIRGLWISSATKSLISRTQSIHKRLIKVRKFIKSNLDHMTVLFHKRTISHADRL